MGMFEEWMKTELQRFWIKIKGQCHRGRKTKIKRETRSQEKCHAEGRKNNGSLGKVLLWKKKK
jgi:hypothetical protein